MKQPDTPKINMKNKKLKNIDEMCGQKPGAFNKFIKGQEQELSGNELNRKIRIRAAKFKKDGEEYPFVKAVGLTIINENPNAIPGIKGEDLKNKLSKKQLEKFCDLFGAQTCGENGSYVYDVDDCLCRLFTGNLQGTQLYFD